MRGLADSQTGKYGELARRWKGERASYSAIHHWVKKHYGAPNRCENPNCPKITILYEWSNISGKYIRERTDWQMLCRSCHRRFDKRDGCYENHPYDEATTYVNKRGHRTCKICRRLRSVTET